MPHRAAVAVFQLMGEQILWNLKVFDKNIWKFILYLANFNPPCQIYYDSGQIFMDVNGQIVQTI